jgi:hypothetical protein
MGQNEQYINPLKIFLLKKIQIRFINNACKNMILASCFIKILINEIY